MATRRCSLHNINYPSDYRAANCVVCNEATDYISNVDPDPDWADKVAVLLEQQVVDATEAPDIPKVEARVYVCGENLCVNSDDVYHSGVRRDWPLKPTTLLQIGQQTFEVLAFRREPKRQYVIRPFSTTLDADNLRRLACPD